GARRAGGRWAGRSAAGRRLPRRRPPMMRTLPSRRFVGAFALRGFMPSLRGAVLPWPVIFRACADKCIPPLHWRQMVSFFRRKKDQDAAADKAGETRKGGLDIEALAAAFPKPPGGDADDRAGPGRGTGGKEESRAGEAPAPAASGTPEAADADAAVLEDPVPAEPAVPAPTAAPVAPAPPPAAGTPEKPAAAPGKPGWRERLRGSGFSRGLGGLFSRNPKLDDDLLDEVETALITADVGVTATTELVEQLRKRMKAREFADAAALLAALRAELVALLQPVSQPLAIDTAARPFVILTVGVNGVGKTTTIGKLAKRYKDEGRGLMLAAGDTFRAAAVAQLQAWGERNGVAVV